jgi:5-formyltetrahydrofolate cyclo-ligase
MHDEFASVDPTKPDIKASKIVLRSQLREARRAFYRQRDHWLEANQRLKRRALSLVSRLSHETVFVYLSTADEASTHELVQDLVDLGVEVMVPYINDKKCMSASRMAKWSELVRGPMGILQPPEERPCAGKIAVALVPGLGFSLNGGRLGYGKGFYDGWLAANPDVQRVGFGFEAQLLTELPMEAHDQKLDCILTEAALHSTRSDGR